MGLLGLLSLAVAAGCSLPWKTPHEAQDPVYQQAQAQLQKGCIHEALHGFLQVIDKQPQAPQSHLELGRLYLHHYQDPISAIYHFRQYLALQPQAPQVPMVQGLIESAQKVFLCQIPGNLYSSSDNPQQLGLIQQLKAENTRLRNTLERLQAAATAQADPSPQPNHRSHGNDSSAPARSQHTAHLGPAKDAHTRDASATSSPQSPSGPAATYSVQPGDTLSKISIRLYGTSRRWQDIYKANQDRLHSAEDLSIGQVLVIPH